MPAERAPRIALVGPRRVRQGLGPFIARFLGEAGFEIPAVIGTSSDSVEKAVEELCSRFDIRTQGYLSVSEALEHHQLDAVAIASPASTHRHYLEQALPNCHATYLAEHGHYSLVHDHVDQILCRLID